MDILKSEKACMGSKKQPYWHMSNYKNTWHCIVKCLLITHMACGATPHSLWQLTTLVSNTSTEMMETIIFQHPQDKHSFTIDWSGDSYLGLTINSNYEKGYVVISMPDYVPKVLAKFKYRQPGIPQHAPHARTMPVYWKNSILNH